MIQWLNNIDVRLFLFLNGHHSPFWDDVMWFVSGKMEWIPLYIILLYAIIIRFGKKSIWIFLGVTILITLSDQVSVKLFKDVFERLRPCHNPEIAELVHKVNNKCGGQYGFVSSHAANSFALAVFTAILFHARWYTITILAWAILVSYSRVYLGVHYPGDIFVGALVGTFLAWIVYRPVSLMIQGRRVKT